HDREQVLVTGADHAASQHAVPDPGHQARPVAAAHQHDRELGYLARLDQGQRLEQLVQRAEPAGQHDERLRVLDEHGLADEEVAELQADLDVVVEPHLGGQLYTQADRNPADAGGALVGRLHDAGPTPGDHRVAGPGQRLADGLGNLVIRAVPLGPGAAEDRHGQAELGQQPETLDELSLDAQHPPRVGVHPVARAAAVQQPLIGGGLGDEVAAQHGWSLAADPAT